MLTCKHTYTYIYIYVDVYIYIYIYMYMYTYMNNPGWVPRAGVLGYRGRMGWACRAAERLVMHGPCMGY